MKNTTYYIAALLIGTLLFFIIKMQKAPSATSKEIAPKTIIAPLIVPFSNENNHVIPIPDKEAFLMQNLTGSYWNHPYVRLDDNDMSDVVVSVYYDNDDALTLQFEYYEPIVFEGKRMGVLRDGGATTLSPFSETTFLIDDPDIEYLHGHKKLCFIKVDNQVGISFDGETIRYFKEAHIFPELKPEALMKHFYPDLQLDEERLIAMDSIETGEHNITFRGIDYFKENGNNYALVFFEDQHFTYGYRYGEDIAFVSIAKFQEKDDGQMRLLNFIDTCACGYYIHSEKSYLTAIRPVLQKVGPKHFLFKKAPRQDGDLNITTLYVYDTKNFKEVLAIDLEAYQMNEFGEKEYILNNTFSITEEGGDHAILIHAGNMNQSKFFSTLEVYALDEESNTFAKADMNVQN